jgi:hypothetical protein
MATVEEATQVETPEQEPMVAAVEAINVDYNKAVEELALTEEAVQDAQNTIFKLFLNVSQKSSASGLDAAALESTSYSAVYGAYISLKEDVYTKQAVCFRLLQKLRAAHNSYLMAVITTLQKQLADAKK